MKPLSELDHYEVLEISRDASFEEIERAYRVARSAYAEGSLATYSVFGERDVEALRHRIEIAWRTLGDPAARCEYDELIVRGDGAQRVPEQEFHSEPEAEPDLGPDPLLERMVQDSLDEPPGVPQQASASRPSAAPEKTAASRAVPVRSGPAIVHARPPLDPEDVGGEYDGERLRRARQKRGLEIDDIAAVTKINPMYLRFIEADALDQLPAEVYVRGFVKAFALCVGLDPVAAVASYMTRFETPQPRKRGRILGRQPQA
jgi:flagellar biosynthesis protein FlhG